HLDGYHKLIYWGFVIHGLIDGFCQTVSLLLLDASISSHILTLFERPPESKQV
ncbi:hypothetical protein HD554DRAFT_2016771, partial [Boletus coccyginus]